MRDSSNATGLPGASQPTPSRRTVLAGVAAAAALGGAKAASAAPAAGHPDAALLALCERFHALEAEWSNAYPTGGTLEDEKVWERLSEPVLAKRAETVSAICSTHATTLAGVQARARVLLTVTPEMFRRIPDDEDYQDCRLAAALVRDLLALEARA